MNLLKPFEFIPGVKWFETEMHDSLFQHSVFGAIVFLIVSHTDVYKFVGKLIDVKDKNILMLVHAVVFAVIMYFGSMYLFAPLLAEGLTGPGSPRTASSTGPSGECTDGTAAQNIVNCIATSRPRKTAEECMSEHECPGLELGH